VSDSLFFSPTSTSPSLFFKKDVRLSDGRRTISSPTLFKTKCRPYQTNGPELSQTKSEKVCMWGRQYKDKHRNRLYQKHNRQRHQAQVNEKNRLYQARHRERLNQKARQYRAQHQGGCRHETGNINDRGGNSCTKDNNSFHQLLSTSHY